MDSSRLGHIVQEINVLVAGLRNGFISCVKEFGNLVTHSLARYAKSISNRKTIFLYIHTHSLFSLQFLLLLHIMFFFFFNSQLFEYKPIFNALEVIKYYSI